MNAASRCIVLGACLSTVFIMNGCAKHHDKPQPGSSYDIRGKVTGLDAGEKVTISLSRGEMSVSDVETAGDGSYVFQNIAEDTYKVTPKADGYTFEPTSLDITVKGSDVTVSDFKATQVSPTAKYTISGKVTLDGAEPVGVTMTLSGKADRTTTIDASGTFQFDKLESGEYTVIPSADAYTFNPSNKLVKVEDKDVESVDFEATICKNSWCSQRTPPSATGNLKAVWGTSEKNVWAVGENGVILHYDGNPWQSAVETPVTTAALNAVWGTESDVWVVGDGGVVLHSTGGKDWATATVPDGFKNNLNGVWGTATESAVWVVGDSGVILKCALANGNVTCSIQSQTVTQANLTSIWGSSNTDVWAVGKKDNKSTILHLQNNEWSDDTTSKNNAPLADYNDISASSDNESDAFWATGGGVILHRCRWQGQFQYFWREVEDGSVLNGIWNDTAKSSVWAVGYKDNTGIILSVKINQSTAGWEIQEPQPSAMTSNPPPLRGIWADAVSSSAWVVGDKGTILKWFP